MTTEADVRLVAAARSGDEVALELLVAKYLPLVHAIVDRALTRAPDVDDTVQETMLNVVRALPGLRSPETFRSWLVAITMNQIRKHHRRLQPELRPTEAFDGVADPGSDFSDLAVWELVMSSQRREAATATVWLDDDDRELLSLWWQVEAGRLSRTEMVSIRGLDPHLVTVQIGRVKSRLDTARRIVRALAMTPGCFGLVAATVGWPGTPTLLWRKRIARHMRECGDCTNAAEDLVPVERLLVGPSLVGLSVERPLRSSHPQQPSPVGRANLHRRASRFPAATRTPSTRP